MKPGSGPQRYLWKVKGSGLDARMEGWQGGVGSREGQQKQNLSLRKERLGGHGSPVPLVSSSIHVFIQHPPHTLICQVPPICPADTHTHTVLDARWSSVNICRKKEGQGRTAVHPLSLSPLTTLVLLGPSPLWLSPEPAAGLLASSRRPVLRTYTHGDS